MPQGTPTPKVMGFATKLLFATWKISTRWRVGFVRYSSFRLALKIASAILPPSGSANVRPATTTTVSTPLDGVAPRAGARGAEGVITVLVCEKAQFLAVARSHA